MFFLITEYKNRISKIKYVKILYIFVLIVLMPMYVYSQDFSVGEIDESRFEYAGQNWQDADRGILLNGAERIDDDTIVVRLFENQESNRRIYYTGANYRGRGVFGVDNNGVRNIILETGIRYGPAIFWHGGNIAEIIIPTGSPFTHSFFYDFEDNRLSSSYYFPMYYDIDNKVILVWGDEDLELYDIKTDELLRTYYVRRRLGLRTYAPSIQYYIDGLDSRLILYYKDDEDNQGVMILEIPARATPFAIVPHKVCISPIFLNNRVHFAIP